MIRTGRAYTAPTSDDGARVLVDRLWPRGLRKVDAAIDEWCKLVAPSTALRRWYGHDPARFAEFAQRYLVELDDPEHAAAVAKLRELEAARGTITLLTATADLSISHVAVLVRRLGEVAEDPVELLRRWEAFGATWRVLGRGADGVTVSLCRCDGGEEVQQLTSADPALITYLGDRTSSED
jgi:uncharacterized protein YeaO (DUF488 family)